MYIAAKALADAVPEVHPDFVLIIHLTLTAKALGYPSHPTLFHIEIID